MTDFANLVIKMDASEVREGVAELEKLAPAGKRAETATDQFSGSAAKASTVINRYREMLASGAIEHGNFAQGIQQAKASLQGIEGEYRRATAAATQHNVAAQSVTVSAGAQRAGMQQLSYQIGDVAQQFAMGTNPMIIFAQQGGQVIQALQLMRGSAGGLIGFLAGPWGAVIMGAVTVAGMFASKLWETKEAADGAADGFANAAAEARGLIGAMNALALNEARIKRNKTWDALAEKENLRATGVVTRGQVYAKDDWKRGIYGGKPLWQLDQEIMAERQELIRQDNLIKIAERENAAIDAKARASERATRATGSATRANRGYSESARDAAREAERFAKELTALGEDAINGVLLGNIAREKNVAADLQSDLFDMNAELKRNQEDRTKGVLEEAAARARLNDQLRETIMSLDQLGGMGRNLGDIGAFVYGARTGDFSGARGPAGFLAQTFLTTFDADGKRVLNGLGQDFSKALDKIFGTTGTFTKLLQGAGVGSAIGGMVFGQNSGANLGATLGGAFGESAFKSLAPKLFSSLGNFAGPLGTIAGSLLGGIFGSLFGKRPRGSGSVSNTGYGSSANDAGVGQSLDSFGMGLQSSIANIAQQLGGTVGAYSIGIGQYKDYYQVSGAANDPRLGGTYFGKKSSSALYDGKDAAAAMRAAIAGAIAQGALQGISAGAQTLLKSGKDIEAQLAKALKFQGVFDELKQSTDPLGAALDEITKRFDELRTIFAEAGASAEEYAQLEQLLALKRQEAQDDARRAVVDKVRDPIEMQIRLLELLGREEDALAASRLLELAGIKAALQPLQTMIYQLEDARKIIDTFEPLANDLKAFRDELLGGRGSDSFGYIAAQFRAIADAAAGGDATAMGKLRGAGTAYLDAARLNAGSDLEYRRALATVLTGVNGGIFAAETQVDYAQAQIDAINNSADILARMREEMSVLQTQIVENTGFVARLWSRFEGEGMPIRTLDEPLEIVAVGL